MIAGRTGDGMAAKPDQLKHRKRLRARFLEAGAEALADYELLELLLFAAIPRHDTKPVAKALLDRFKTYQGVLRAPVEALTEIDGVGESAAVAIKAVEAAALRLARKEMLDRPVLGSWTGVIDYLRMRMAHGEVEQLRVLFLDSKNGVIEDEELQRGTVNHTAVYPREILKRALEHGATALILVHNHPSGDPTPSRADIEMTRQIRDAAEKLGVALHDHVVIARGRHASFKTMGLL
jgi:DNA repair protein RadC